MWCILAYVVDEILEYRQFPLLPSSQEPHWISATFCVRLVAKWRHQQLEWFLESLVELVSLLSCLFFHVIWILNQAHQQFQNEEHSLFSLVLGIAYWADLCASGLLQLNDAQAYCVVWVMCQSAEDCQAEPKSHHLAGFNSMWRQGPFRLRVIDEIYLIAKPPAHAYFNCSGYANWVNKLTKMSQHSSSWHWLQPNWIIVILYWLVCLHWLPLRGCRLSLLS